MLLVLLLYGPKLGVLDLRIVALFLILPLLDKKVFADRLVRSMAALVFFLFVYGLLVGLVYGNVEINLFKYIRVLVSMVIISVMFSSWALNKFDELAKLIGWALFLHVAVVWLMFLVPGSQNIFHELYGYNKGLRPLRFTGLSAGFDISGVLCVLAASFYYMKFKYDGKRLIDLMFLIICLSAALFTSRGSMLIMLALSGWIYMDILRSKFRIGVKLLFLLSGLGMLYIAVVSFVLPIFSNSVIGVEYAGQRDLGVNENYSKTDVTGMLRSFMVTPEEPTGLLWGVGVVPSVDSGYIRTIWQVGIVGLVLSLTWYLVVFVRLKKYKIAVNVGNWSVNTMYFTGQMALISCVVLSVKNQYFFTRSVTEIGLISVFFLMMLFRRFCNGR